MSKMSKLYAKVMKEHDKGLPTARDEKVYDRWLKEQPLSAAERMHMPRILRRKINEMKVLKG